MYIMSSPCKNLTLRFLFRQMPIDFIFSANFMVWPKDSLQRDYKVWFESVSMTAWVEITLFRRTEASLPPNKTKRLKTKNLYRRRCNWKGRAKKWRNYLWLLGMRVTISRYCRRAEKPQEGGSQLDRWGKTMLRRACKYVIQTVAEQHVP